MLDNRSRNSRNSKHRHKNRRLSIPLIDKSSVNNDTKVHSPIQYKCFSLKIFRDFTNNNDDGDYKSILIELAVLLRCNNPCILPVNELQASPCYSDLKIVAPIALCNVSMLRYNPAHIIKQLYNNPVLFRVHKQNGHSAEQEYDMPTNVKIYVTYSLLGGLSYLHYMNILHGDVRPDNLYVYSDGSVKLANLKSSLSMFLNNVASQITSRKLYRLNYRSPELILSPYSRVSLATDIWAAGCSIMEICRGRKLFIGKNNTELLGDIFKVMGTPEDSDIEWLSLQRPLYWRPMLYNSKYNKYYLLLCDMEQDSDNNPLLDIMLPMFEYNIKNRPTAETLLHYNIFDIVRINEYDNFIIPPMSIRFSPMTNLNPKFSKEFKHAHIINMAYLLELIIRHKENINIYLLCNKYIAILRDIIKDIQEKNTILFYYACFSIASEIICGIPFEIIHLTDMKMSPRTTGIVSNSARLNDLKRKITYYLSYNLLLRTEISYMDNLEDFQYQQTLKKFMIFSFVILAILPESAVVSSHGLCTISLNIARIISSNKTPTSIKFTSLNKKTIFMSLLTKFHDIMANFNTHFELNTIQYLERLTNKSFGRMESLIAKYIDKTK